MWGVEDGGRASAAKGLCIWVMVHRLYQLLQRGALNAHRCVVAPPSNAGRRTWLTRRPRCTARFAAAALPLPPYSPASELPPTAAGRKSMERGGSLRHDRSMPAGGRGQWVQVWVLVMVWALLWARVHTPGAAEDEAGRRQDVVASVVASQHRLLTTSGPHLLASAVCMCMC